MQPRPEADKTNETSPLGKALKVLSYPIALVSGFWTTKINVSDAVYERLKIDGGIQDIRNPLLAKRKVFTEETIQKMNGTSGEQATQDFVAASKATDRSYFKQIEKRLDELGLNTFSKQWKFIHRGQKQTAIINGLTVSGIAVGSLLTIANSKTLSTLLDEDEKTKAPPSPPAL